MDGILHYLLVVEFDVLMGYAVTGMVVAFLLATTPRAQRVWMWVQGSLHLVVLTLITAGAAFAGKTARDPDSIGLYTEGSWWQQVMFRLENPGLLRAEALIILPPSITLFLIGAHLFRGGLFDERGRRLRRVLITLGAVALPVDLAIGSLGEQWGMLLTRYGTAPLVALGLLGAVTR